MAKYEITLTATVEAANEADAEKKKAVVSGALRMAKTMLQAQGVKVLGDIQVSAPKKV